MNYHVMLLLVNGFDSPELIEWSEKPNTKANFSFDEESKSKVLNQKTLKGIHL